MKDYKRNICKKKIEQYKYIWIYLHNQYKFKEIINIWGSQFSKLLPRVYDIHLINFKTLLRNYFQFNKKFLSSTNFKSIFLVKAIIDTKEKSTGK